MSDAPYDRLAAPESADDVRITSSRLRSTIKLLVRARRARNVAPRVPAC